MGLLDPVLLLVGEKELLWLLVGEALVVGVLLEEKEPVAEREPERD